ncbi:NAD-dependent epimerase/dehydratase family protein [Nonomuraea sp. NPDC050202]|uniref:NAD-dependent epimerase/dehydratase family protein n=1 Tax=Nonomuraea sp. NPDC050202 TaxID=3155035 RepID=UPI0033E9DAF7
MPVDEEIPLQVEDPYGLSTQADELTAAMMSRRHGMTTVALRFPRLGGPRDKLRHAAREWAADRAAGARELWSYLDVRDAARAAWLAVTRPVEGHHVVTVAAPNTLMSEPTEKLLAVFHPDSERRAPVSDRAVPVDLGAAERVDLGAAERVLGFTARHVLP